MNKRVARARRTKKTRGRIARLNISRLTVHRTLSHIYAQIFSIDGTHVLLAASSLEKALASQLKGKTGNVAAATAVGKLIAERAKKAKITKVAFDRSGYKYHGRLKALAEAAREGGLEF